VKQELPETCVQWEDFARAHARPILERYRDDFLTFNDDIQGTAAVTLGAILSAVKVGGTRFKDQQIVFFGAPDQRPSASPTIFATHSYPKAFPSGTRVSSSGS
jgi:malic enzyme